MSELQNSLAFQTLVQSFAETIEEALRNVFRAGIVRSPRIPLLKQAYSGKFVRQLSALAFMLLRNSPSEHEKQLFESYQKAP